MADINWKTGCWVTTIFLVRDDGCVLLTWNKNLNTWIPVGGHIDPGEQPDEAIAREVKEETGFEFEFLEKPEYENNNSVRVIKPHRMQIEKVPHHNYHINCIFFGKCTNWNNRAATDENEKLRWFSEQELIGMKDQMIESVWKLSLEAVRRIK